MKKFKSKKDQHSCENHHHHGHFSHAEKIAEMLKTHGLSITAPRKAILDLLLTEHGPFSVEDILNKLPKNSCDQATIYRSLNQFVEANLVTTTNLEKDVIHYEIFDQHHHHHHIVCKICKKIDSLEECFLDKIEALILKKGYKDIAHKLEFFGICPKCAK